MNRQTAIRKAREILNKREAEANAPKIACIVVRPGCHSPAEIGPHTLLVKLCGKINYDDIPNPTWTQTKLYQQILSNRRNRNETSIHTI